MEDEGIGKLQRSGGQRAAVGRVEEAYDWSDDVDDYVGEEEAVAGQQERHKRDEGGMNVSVLGHLYGRHQYMSNTGYMMDSFNCYKNSAGGHLPF